MTAVYVHRIPWRPYSPTDPRPLNRHVRHDPRSLSYKVKADGVVKAAAWLRRIPVLDQGSIGACTGFAACGVLGTDPFHDTLTDRLAKGLVLDEIEARDVLYHVATTLDDYPGTWQPDDTGSDGLSVAKAAQQQGLISGYRHITSVAAAQTAIASGPFITGINWYDGFDQPDGNGVVRVSGSVRGGHEFEVFSYDPVTDLWGAWNSWGPGFGQQGRFYFTSGTYAQLLAQDGDATTFVPLTAPPPVPTPVTADAALVDAGNAWERTILSRITKAGKMRSAFDGWKTAHGY